MIKVMHIITTLGPAGAENMLMRMALGMDEARFQNEVVSLTGILDLAERMQSMGVPVRTLDMKKGVPNPLAVRRLANWIRESKPDVIQTWMYHSNLVGVLAARLAGNVPVVWGIHHNTFDPKVDKLMTRLVNHACAFLSRKLPARIVCCSEASYREHKRLGYDTKKLQIIPNGFDLDQIKPDPAGGICVREELGIPARALVIGMAARFHPHKDHRNFLLAAARLHKEMPEIHFLLCGLHVSWGNAQLAKWIDAAGIRDRCHLLGTRQDMPRVFAAMDIATSASRSEAFPIAIGEAMACGTPCVVTDVGDSALIVDQTGVVVPHGDATALTEGWRKLIQAGPMIRRWLGTEARNRIGNHFALPAIVERYQAIYGELAARTKRDLPSESLSEYAH